MYTNRRNQKIKLFTRGATTEWMLISHICGALYGEKKMSFAKVIKNLNLVQNKQLRAELKAYFKSLW